MAETRLRGVLLDMDGTLVDSNDAHARAWVKALAEEGFAVPFERVRRLIGMGGDTLLPEVTGLSKETPQGERLATRWGEIFQEEFLPHLRPFPQACALVARMHDAGLRLVVASSSQREQLRALLDIVGIAELVDEVTSTDDAERSKPAPDIVEVALAKLDLPPDAALLLGDTPYDIEAAHGAGVRVIALRSGGFTDHDLAGALAIYDDTADLLARYAASPLANGSDE